VSLKGNDYFISGKCEAREKLDTSPNLWQEGQKERNAFVGDTTVDVGGRWIYWVVAVASIWGDPVFSISFNAI